MRQRVKRDWPTGPLAYARGSARLSEPRPSGSGCRNLCTLVFVLLSGSAMAADLRLVEAAQTQDWEQVRALLQQHVDVNAPQGDGAVALHWAAYWDDPVIADLLLRAGAKVNAANELGVTPLALASSG